MTPARSAVTPERYASGMTFERYLAYIASPESLRREGSGGAARRDWSAVMRQTYEAAHLSEAQAASWKWLAAQPGGPARILAISEEWSSDCRRDIPVVARVAETAGLELRIFARDGQTFGREPRPDPARSPNADLMAEFLNDKNGQTWQSIPVVAFYTRDFELLHRYIEYPAIYHKDRIRGHMTAARPGETAEQTRARGDREFTALQQSPFFRVWACAGVDEMLSALHERLTVGPPA